MYELRTVKTVNNYGWMAVVDENGTSVALVSNKIDAEEIVALLNLGNVLLARFPGFSDTETEINGGDLIDEIGLCCEVKNGRWRRARS